MSDADPRFIEFIRKAVAALGLPEPTIDENRFLFQVGERWVELKYRPAADRVIFASLIYISEPKAVLPADMVSSFNCYNLFEGGFTLVPSDGELLYLCRPSRLARLNPYEIRAELEYFMLRAVAASAWSMNAIEAKTLAPSQPPDGSADAAPMMRI